MRYVQVGHDSIHISLYVRVMKQGLNVFRWKVWFTVCTLNHIVYKPNHGRSADMICVFILGTVCLYLKLAFEICTKFHGLCWWNLNHGNHLFCDILGWRMADLEDVMLFRAKSCNYSTVPVCHMKVWQFTILGCKCRGSFIHSSVQVPEWLRGQCALSISWKSIQCARPHNSYTQTAVGPQPTVFINYKGVTTVAIDGFPFCPVWFDRASLGFWDTCHILSQM